MLLDKDRKAKISDFGLARSIQVIDRESVSANALNACGTHGYMPPEAKYGAISRKYDVYGFGVVSITVFTLNDHKYEIIVIADLLLLIDVSICYVYVADTGNNISSTAIFSKEISSYAGNMNLIWFIIAHYYRHYTMTHFFMPILYQIKHF